MSLQKTHNILFITIILIAAFDNVKSEVLNLDADRVCFDSCD